MKQEATNVFNEGLNYDLNPLTTPNNVLTDCINGTFITFNGDELALQNDAGNTTIKYNLGTESNPNLIDVALSPGFYPIGIKEYGGVLYIVSACTKDTIEEWVNTGVYYPGNLTKVSINGGWNYYKCIDTITQNVVPNTDTTHWEFQPEDAELSRIEFGSYPSPSASVPNDVDNNLPLTYNVINTDKYLYSSGVVNNSNFTAGRYLNFTIDQTNGLDLSQLSYYEYSSIGESTYHKRFYKIKLLQQLTNGYIDLTNGAWDQFAKFKATAINQNNPETPLFWFSDPQFNYFCPNNFKGKPTIITEIEPLDTFKLTNLSLNTVNAEYVFNFEVQLEHSTTLDIPEIKYQWFIDGIEKGIDEATITNGYATFEIPLSVSQYYAKGSILSYIITPNVYYNTLPINDELPEEYFSKNNYRLTGTRSLFTDFDNIILFRDPDDYTCVIGDDGILNGDSEYNKLILKNKKGELLDNNYQVSPYTQYYFKKWDSNSSIPVDDAYNVCLGFYSILDTGYALYYGPASNIIISEIETLKVLLNQQLVVYRNENCLPVTLTVTTNKKLYSSVLGKVTVNYNSSEQIVMASELGDDQFIFSVPKNVPLTVKVEYDTDALPTKFILSKHVTFIGNINSGITEDQTVNMALINTFTVTVETSIVGGLRRYTYKGIVNTPILLPPYSDNPIPYGRFYNHKLSSSSLSPHENVLYAYENGSVERHYISMNDLYFEVSPTFSNKTFDFGVYPIGYKDTYALPKQYLNISNNSNYVMIGTPTSSDGYEIFPTTISGIYALPTNFIP